MRLSYPTTLLSEAIPLNEFDLGPRGNAAINLLQRHNFSAGIGPTLELLPEIQVAAKEPEIADNCPNDQIRFAYQNILGWFKKGRIQPFIRTPKRALGAYGWLGPEDDLITTAYRVTEAGASAAREIRHTVDPNFRPGLLLGEIILGVGIFQFGYQPRHIGLETWKSNDRAQNMYRQLGFVKQSEVVEERGRPTIHKVGEYINGNPVYIDPKNPKQNRVLDSRCRYILENYES